MQATDPDCGVNAMVNYTLAAGRLENEQLAVRSDTGDICVRTPLDREAAPYLEIPVIATDRGTYVHAVQWHPAGKVARVRFLEPSPRYLVILARYVGRLASAYRNESSVTKIGGRKETAARTMLFLGLISWRRGGDAETRTKKPRRGDTHAGEVARGRKRTGGRPREPRWWSHGGRASYRRAKI